MCVFVKTAANRAKSLNPDWRAADGMYMHTQKPSRHTTATSMLLACTILFCGCTSQYQNGWQAYESGSFSSAYQEWQPLAEQGNPKAQYLLGVLHQDGQGVPQDHVVAANWYQRAAEQGFAPAQNNLGLMYYKGEGVPQNRHTAAMWYERAAVQGHAHAQNNLAVMHMLGQVPASDPDRARQLFTMAAANGNVKSQDILQHWNLDAKPAAATPATTLAVADGGSATAGPSQP